MAAYFTSDVHLRLDRPGRSRVFARWVDGLEPGDSLTIVGDLCDFWYASRERERTATTCPGLEALARFRARGGELTIVPGNHDAWLGPFYERLLGARFVAEPLEVEAYGLRLVLYHGHKLGGYPAWKGWMESRAFLYAFQHTPSPLASALDRLLERRNERSRDADNQRQANVYRQFVTRLAGQADIVVIGHVHRTLDCPELRPRLVVPGGWYGQSSYLKVDESGAVLHVSRTTEPLAC